MRRELNKNMMIALLNGVKVSMAIAAFMSCAVVW